VADQKSSVVEETFRFGPFALFRGSRVLIREGQKVRIGGRALDILIALVEKSGEVVSKEDLITTAWPHTFVDESNLRVHIAALRKLLGEGFGGDPSLVNVAGRGYLFTPAVDRSLVAEMPPPALASAPAAPDKVHRLIGRDEIVQSIAAQVGRHRLITIAGPGGVGKTSVALAASALVEERSRPHCFVDLASISSPDLLPSAIAGALDVAVLTRDPVSNLVAFLADKSLLLVLDNCEHLVDAVAVLVELLMPRVPGIAFLLTSREPLRANAELVVRLQPLEVPGADVVLDAASAVGYPAIRLFVERATSSSDSFEFGDGEVASVAEICRRLDGLPLAIELIAARVDLFGIRALATDLSARLMLGARGERGAQPRQQSIRAALDWSHNLLSPVEKLIFRRLSVFRGLFSLESAVEVIADAAVTTDEVLDAMDILTAKSLVGTDTGGARLLYRLLHVTRIYGGEKLTESAETELMARRHARHFRDLLTTAEAQWETLTRQQWLDVHGYVIEDVRAALDWAFGASGDLEIGAQLITASLPFGFQLSLMDEFKVRAERALTLLDTGHSAVSRLRLITALIQFALGSAVDEATLQALFDRFDSLSVDVSETKFKIEPLLARAIYLIERGENDAALDEVVRIGHSAREAADPLGVLATERIEAQAQFFVGNFPQARATAERVIRHPARTIPLLYSSTTVDRQITMRIIIARALWIEGHVDQGIDLMAQTMDMAYRDGPLPITFALAMGACPIALWSGDRVAAQRYTDELLTYSRRYTLERWERLGEGFAATLDRIDTPPRNDHGMGLSIAEPVSELHRMQLATIDAHYLNDALAAQAEQGLCGWCNSEILRLCGERVLQRGGAGARETAQRYFESAIAAATKQGALSWQLRATISLAMLWQGQHRAAAAGAVLKVTLARFSEGFGTTDLMRARALLDQLEP